MGRDIFLCALLPLNKRVLLGYLTAFKKPFWPSQNCSSNETSFKSSLVHIKTIVVDENQPKKTFKIKRKYLIFMRWP